MLVAGCGEGRVALPDLDSDPSNRPTNEEVAEMGDDTPSEDAAASDTDNDGGGTGDGLHCDGGGCSAGLSCVAGVCVVPSAAPSAEIGAPGEPSDTTGLSLVANMEQRCSELGAACVVSEPMDTNNYQVTCSAPSNHIDFADSEGPGAKEADVAFKSST
jgi:hypothetical protein